MFYFDILFTIDFLAINFLFHPNAHPNEWTIPELKNYYNFLGVLEMSIF